LAAALDNLEQLLLGELEGLALETRKTAGLLLRQPTMVAMAAKVATLCSALAARAWPERTGRGCQGMTLLNTALVAAVALGEE